LIQKKEGNIKQAYIKKEKIKKNKEEIKFKKNLKKLIKKKSQKVYHLIT
jgi:hypothetical protein